MSDWRNTRMMYGPAVFEPKPKVPLVSGLKPSDLLPLANPQAATIDELNTLTKRLEALEAEVRAMRKAKRKRKKRST